MSADTFALDIVIETELDDHALMFAVKHAVEDFCRTDAGQKELTCNNGNFNYGDLMNTVPGDTCETRGSKIVDTFITELVVNHGSLLACEN